MKVCMLALRTAAILMLLLPCVAAAQSSDYTMELITGSTTSSGTPSLTIAAGSTGSGVVFIIPQTGFNQQISFSCVGVPANGSCIFNPTTVTPDGNPNNPVKTTLTFSTTATITAGMSPSHKRWMMGAGALMFGTLLVLPFNTRRRKIACMLTLLAMVSCLPLAGCGGGSSTSNTVKTGTYSVVVTSTAGTIIKNATLSVTVD